MRPDPAQRAGLRLGNPRRQQRIEGRPGTATASSGPVRIALDEREWRLLRALREIPPSPLRDRTCALIDEIVALVAAPGCSEAQADGVPCADAHLSCDRCRPMLGLLDGLRSRLRER